MHDPAATIGKIRRRVVLPFVLLLIISSLDRANLSFASLQMNAELGLTHADYGMAVSAFFVGYLLFQFPSMYLLHRFGARRWITGSVLLWGAFALAMAFVHSAATLYLLRCLLGVAEAGFAPGVVYLCSRWMPARHRAGAIALTMLAVPISVTVGGPFSGWLMSVANPLGLAGWRWMFLAEAGLTLALAVLAWRLFVDTPAQAAWLDPAERDWLRQQVAHDDAVAAAEGAQAGSSSGARLFRDARLWIAGAVWFVLIAGAYAILFWLPQVARQMSARSAFEIGLVSAVPWLGIGLGMFFNSRHSDRRQERFWHVLLPLLLCSGCLAAAPLAGASTGALVLLFCAGLGLGSAQGVFWTIPTGFLRKEDARNGITAINLLGNLGGLFGPYAIGVVRQSTGSFTLPVQAMALLLLVSALLLLGLRTRRAPPAAAQRA
jgi:ACS family tartrate transporter-like MFS transporter